MATAWGPRITATTVPAGVDLPTGDETPLATLTTLSTNDVNERVLLHGWVVLSVDAACTQVNLNIHRGDINGDVVATGEVAFAAGVVANTTAVVDGLDDLGPAVQGQVYTLTVVMVGAVGDSFAGAVFFSSTVF